MGRSDLRSDYKWWVVAMLWFVRFFNYADRQAIFAVFPKLKVEFGFDNEQLGYVGSAFMWVYAAGAPRGNQAGSRPLSRAPLRALPCRRRLARLDVRVIRAVLALTAQPRITRKRLLVE